MVETLCSSQRTSNVTLNLMANKEIKANLTLIVSMSIHVYVHTLFYFRSVCVYHSIKGNDVKHCSYIKYSSMSRVLSLMFFCAGCVLASFTWEFVWISGWWSQTYDVSTEEREFRTDKITYLMILFHPCNVRSETRKEVACLV